MNKRNVKRFHKSWLSKCVLVAFFMSACVFLTSFTSAVVLEEKVQATVVETVEESSPLDSINHGPVLLESTESYIWEPPIPLLYPEPEQEPTQKLWTDEEVIVLAKMLYGEARGVPSKMEQAGCVWCVCNRCDVYNEGVVEITTAPYQFVGYDPNNPILDELYDLCEDVLSRWYAEKAGEVNVGRVLPSDFLYFYGDGQHNYFRNEYKGGTTWDWSYPNPYET